MHRLAVLSLLTLGACYKPTPPPSYAKSAEKFSTIAKGTAFAQKDYVVPGKVSVLVLTADW